MRQFLLNADALKHNFFQVKKCAPASKVLSMVKANAYGHGLLWTAEHLLAAGTDALGVAVLEEAESLRGAGIQAPIFLMDGFLTAEELQQALALDLTLVLHDPLQLILLEQAKLSQALDVWLKVDTGMHRLGLAPETVPALYAKLRALHGIKSISLMTHFAEADNLESTKTEKQIALFDQVRTGLAKKGEEIPSSLANSAGILAWPSTRREWVRPGIMLYGASPFGIPDERLQAVMTVKSKIIAIHDLPAGAQIGYGSTYTCQRPMRVAVLAFGYGDGYPRSALKSQVWVKGKTCEVIGRVSMDMIQIDVTEHPEISLQDEVVLWGENNPIEGLANAAGTISYEIFCRIQHRCKKIPPNTKNSRG